VIPTTRAAGALAVVGGLALILPPWLSVALALILIAATLADGWSVRATPVIARRVPEVVSRGVPVELTVSAEGDSRRVLLRQTPGPELTVVEADGNGTLATALTAMKRGIQTLPGVASASVGPLGLARVQHTRTAPVDIRVLPNVVGAQRLVMRLRRSRTGLTGGRARGPLGLGTQFESVREYTPDDDIRNLNWRATARLDRPMSNQYRVERDRDVICVIDAGRLMTAPLENSSTVLDVALDAVTVIALAADELGDRFGALVFDDEVRQLFTPRHHGGSATVRSLFDLQARPVDSDFEAALIRVSRLRRAVVFVFTDLLDEAAARSLVTGVAVVARRHATYVVSAADPEVAVLAENDDSSPARALAALQVLSGRRLAALQLRQAGTRVIEAAPDQLGARCLDAYFTAKLRARI
jgi:uncharacterized protein (DUF58 family)